MTQATEKAAIDDLNTQTMSKSVGEYLRTSGLTPQEAAALRVVADEARGRPILDLGVGTGRTVEPLREVSRDYVGLDYVPAMVETCRRRFAEVKFVQGDARDLSRFGDGSFFLVMFSLNGICMVDHAGRMAILREIHRVLMPGGAVLFSSYNTNSDNYEATFRLPYFFWSWNPLRLGLRCVRWVKDVAIRLRNRKRFKKLEQRGAEYSIINDACHNYGVMLYYTSLAEHVKQLELVGFREVQAFDQAGRKIETDTRDDSIMFLGRRG